MGVVAARVAEVIVDRLDGERERASGYLIRTGVVLTVQHVLAGARRVCVRFNADQSDERTEPAQVLWADEGCDVAVLGVPDGHNVAPVPLGRIDDADGHTQCQAVGFPAFKLRPYPAGGSYRDSHNAFGHIAPLSNRREGTLELVVSAPPEPDSDSPWSPWAGMSGAAVWVGDHIVGMISRHHPKDGLRMLAVVRTDAWAARLSAPDRLAPLERLLGTRLEPARLPRARAITEPSPRNAPILVGGGLTDRRDPPSREWRGGDEVTVNGHTYLLFDDDVANHVASDPPARVRQGRALRIAPVRGAESAYVWLRQTDRLHKAPGYGGTRQLGDLAREHETLTAGASDPGLPVAECFARDGSTETLAVTWPATSSGAACPTLRDCHGAVTGPLDTWRLGRLLTAMAGLCRTVAKLHARGLSHRALSLDALIRRDDGILQLRDLGLAVRSPRRGESVGAYQAPEQHLSRRGTSSPGLATDVHQIAATVYHLTTGRVPMAETPLPVTALAARTPPTLAEALDAALRAQPDARPTARELGAALAKARAELSGKGPR
ncbi:MAG TPA: trypsin-like peptidase domain-containing protein [Yinghuangia sp.]|nr:trypsin-like peptidase domain-containing protein [Yinghuangia sp.]